MSEQADPYAPITDTEFAALDRYTRSVWYETYSERLAHYRYQGLYTNERLTSMAVRDADRAARIYNFTGERTDPDTHPDFPLLTSDDQRVNRAGN